MAQQISTPRIVAPYLENFINRHVTVIGKVTQLRGEQATVEAEGSIIVLLNRETHLINGNAVQIVGKVNPDLSVKVLKSKDLGPNGDLPDRIAIVWPHTGINRVIQGDKYKTEEGKFDEGGFGKRPDPPTRPSTAASFSTSTTYHMYGSLGQDRISESDEDESADRHKSITKQRAMAHPGAQRISSPPISVSRTGHHSPNNSRNHLQNIIRPPPFETSYSSYPRQDHLDHQTTRDNDGYSDASIPSAQHDSPAVSPSPDLFTVSESSTPLLSPLVSRPMARYLLDAPELSSPEPLSHNELSYPSQPRSSGGLDSLPPLSPYQPPRFVTQTYGPDSLSRNSEYPGHIITQEDSSQENERRAWEGTRNLADPRLRPPKPKIPSPSSRSDSHGHLTHKSPPVHNYTFEQTPAYQPSSSDPSSSFPVTTPRSTESSTTDETERPAEEAQTTGRSLGKKLLDAFDDTINDDDDDSDLWAAVVDGIGRISIAMDVDGGGRWRIKRTDGLGR